MKKKSIFGCLAIICLLLVLIPPVLTRAEKHSLITWEKKSKNVVSMYLELQEKEAFEEIKAFSLTLNFDSKEDLSVRIRLPYCTCLPSKKRTVRLVCLACASLWVTITMVRPSSLLSWWM